MKTKPKVLPKNVESIHQTSIDDIVRAVNGLYDADEMNGLMVSILRKNGNFESWWGGDEEFTYLKTVGMAQTLVHDLITSPNEEE
jgi:hypothetical protein